MTPPLSRSGGPGRLPDVRVLVMAGGKSTRIGGEDKLLLPLCNRPLIEWVLNAACPLGECFIATTPNRKPTMQSIARQYKAGIIETPGKGYPVDLKLALEVLEPPVLIVAGDLPFLTPQFLNNLWKRGLDIDAGLVTIRKCNLSGCKPSGISLWEGGWSWANLDLPYLPQLIDVDTPYDYKSIVSACEVLTDMSPLFS